MPSTWNNILPALKNTLSVWDKVQIHAARHASNYYIHVHPSLVPEESRPTEMVTEQLKIMKMNKRTLQTNMKYAFFIYSAPQNIKMEFEVAIKAARRMYEAVAIADDFWRKFGNYRPQNNTKGAQQPTAEGDDRTGLLADLIYLEPTLVQMLGEPECPLTSFALIKDEVRQARGEFYEEPSNAEEALVLLITHTLYKNL